MRHLKDLSGHGSGIYSLSANESFLYSGSGDGMLASWDLKTLEPAPFSVNVGSPVYAHLVHNEHLLIGQGKGGVHVVNMAEKKEEKHIQIHSNAVFHLLVNEKRNQLYSAGGDGTLGIFDLAGFRLQIQIPLSGKKLRSITLSPDAALLLVSSSDGYIYVLETEYLNELYKFEAHENGVYAMDWLADGTLMTGGRDAHLRFWNVSRTEATEVKNIPAHNYAIYDIAKSSSGMFATASRDKIVKVWNPASFDAPERLLQKGSTSHKSSVNAVAWAGDVLFSAGDDRIIRAWSSSDS